MLYKDSQIEVSETKNTNGQNSAIANCLVNFMYFSNRLKLELRHCWFKNGRQESVAEHSWQLGLLAISVVPYLSIQLNLSTLLKMIVIHDLVEIEAKDIPITQQTAEVKKQKYINECKAIESIKTQLPEPIASEFYLLWHEYENQSSIEAKVLKALDKLEAFMAHNVSDLNTFEEKEKQMYHEEQWLLKPCKVDPLLLEMAKIINQHGIKITGQSCEDLPT